MNVAMQIDTLVAVGGSCGARQAAARSGAGTGEKHGNSSLDDGLHCILAVREVPADRRFAGSARERFTGGGPYNRLMWEAAALIVLAAGVLVWIDSLRARERALDAGRAACAHHGVQFLDDTVAFARLRFGRDEEGRLKLRRTYTFEFSETGVERRRGAIVLLGAELLDLQLEPRTQH